jgi:hypothetical protein
MLVFSAVPALAFSYNPSSGWQLFMNLTDSLAPRGFTVDNNDGSHLPATQYGGMADDSGNPADFSYDFTLGGSGAILQVTDVDQSGDRYRIWDGDAFLGITLASVYEFANKDIFPDPAYANGGLYNGPPLGPFGPEDYSLSTTSKDPLKAIVLGAGDHHLTFQNFAFRDSSLSALGYDPLTGTHQEGFSRGYFRVTSEVPEPGTMALLGLGLAFAGLVIRRKR